MWWCTSNVPLYRPKCYLSGDAFHGSGSRINPIKCHRTCVIHYFPDPLGSLHIYIHDNLYVHSVWGHLSYGDCMYVYFIQTLVISDLIHTCRWLGTTMFYTLMRDSFFHRRSVELNINIKAVYAHIRPEVLDRVSAPHPCTFQETIDTQSHPIRSLYKTMILVQHGTVDGITWSGQYSQPKKLICWYFVVKTIWKTSIFIWCVA